MKAEQVNIVWYEGEIISVTGDLHRVAQIKALLQIQTMKNIFNLSVDNK